MGWLPFFAPRVFPAVRNYVAVGDSITDSDRVGTAQGGGYAKASALLANPVIATFTNRALSGTGIQELIDEAAITDALLQPGQANILSVFIGANNHPDTTFLSALAGYCDARRAAGWHVLLGTLLPQIINPGFLAARATANPEIRLWTTNGSIVPGKHADRIFDFAADPLIGSDASNNTAYIDTIHPTVLGQARMRDIFRPVLDAAMSNVASNPAIVSVSSYTSDAGGADTDIRLRADRGVTWGLSGSSALALDALSQIKLNTVSPGTYSTTVTATDGAGRTSSQTFTWNVLAPPVGYGPNVVLNGNAVNGLLGWTDETLWFTPLDPSYLMSTVAKGGGAEFLLQGNGGGFPQAFRNTTVENAATYKVDCVVRRGTAVGSPTFRVDGATGVSVGSSATVDTPVTGTLVASGASALTMMFINSAAESGNAYFSQIAVRKIL